MGYLITVLWDDSKYGYDKVCATDLIEVGKTHSITCRKCNGSGEEWKGNGQYLTCYTCSGSGKLDVNEKEFKHYLSYKSV